MKNKIYQVNYEKMKQIKIGDLLIVAISFAMPEWLDGRCSRSGASSEGRYQAKICMQFILLLFSFSILFSKKMENCLFPKLVSTKLVSNFLTQPIFHKTLKVRVSNCFQFLHIFWDVVCFKRAKPSSPATWAWSTKSAEILNLTRQISLLIQ